MAYSNKLDTNILNPIINRTTGAFTYVDSSATIELNDVKAYWSFIDQDGSTVTTACVLFIGGNQIMIRETYATIDNKINP